MKKLTSTLTVLGMLALVSPPTSWSQNVNWSEGQTRLQQQLQPGKTPAEYRRMLRDMGYRITSENYDNPNYTEYEIVKGDRSYEVQLDLDRNTGRATGVDIAANVWETPRTDAVLDANERMAWNDPPAILVLTPIYTVDTAERTELEKMVRNLEQLPTGQSKGSYRNLLQERGYQVLDSTNKNNKTQLRVRKDNREALVNVRFDAETGESTQINAFPLMLNTTAQQTAKMQGQNAKMRPSGEIAEAMHELEALPLSRERGYYRQELQRRGFQIVDTDVSENRTRFEAEKNGQRIALDVHFNENTGRSTTVNAQIIPESNQLSQAR